MMCEGVCIQNVCFVCGIKCVGDCRRQIVFLCDKSYVVEWVSDCLFCLWYKMCVLLSVQSVFCV